MSIRARLLWLTLGLMVPMGLVGYYNLWSAWQASREQLNESIEQQANLAATAFEEWIKAQTQTLVTISVLAQSSNQETLKDYLNSIVKTRPHWLDVQIVNPSDQVVLSQTIRDKPLPLVSIETLRQEVFAKKTLVIFTEQVSDENLRLLSLAMPLADGNFVVARIDGTNASSVFTQLELPDENIIAVYDPNNRLLYRNHVSPEQMSLDVNNTKLLSALDGKHTATIEIKSPYDKIERVYGLARVETANCIVTVGVPSAKLYKFAETQYWYQFWFGLIITILAILLALFIAHGIVEPLRFLGKAAREFGAGNLTTRTKIIGSGTLRELGLTFNQMAEQIAEREEKSKELDRLKSEFVSNVSHELRTPLTTIKTLTRVLQNNNTNQSEREEYLQTIAVECDRQIDFIQKLLDLSRIESGAYKVSFQQTDVVKLLSALFEMQQKAARSRNLVLETNLPKSSFPTIQTDSGALQRVILSLLENAMKYTPENGKILISAEQHGEQIAITVSDTGCGIVEEDLPHIFERYYRGRPLVTKVNEHSSVESSGENETSGIGLGLYLVKALVEQLHGEISVESPINKNGQGTRFTIIFSQQPG